MNHTIQRMNYTIHGMVLKLPLRCLTGGYSTEVQASMALLTTGPRRRQPINIMIFL